MIFDSTQRLLVILGQRLRAARIARDDTMQLFAERLGVSEGTLREMERGSPTSQIGNWLNALEILDRLEELDDVLKDKRSLIDIARALQKSPPRKRARRRRK